MAVLRWLDEHFEKTICISLFIIFSAIMIMNVVMRHVFAAAWPWATELVLLIFIWFSMFALSYGFKSGAHVSVDIVVDLLPRPIRLAVKVISNLLVLFLFAFLGYLGISLVEAGYLSGMRGLLVDYPVWLMYLSMPIGMLCSVIRITQNLVKTIKNMKEAEG